MNSCPDAEYSSGFFYDMPMMTETYVEWWQNVVMVLLTEKSTEKELDAIKDVVIDAKMNYMTFVNARNRKSLIPNEQLTFNF